MKIIDKLKELINNNGYKNIIYNFLAVVIICTIALIAWDTFSPNQKKDIAETDLQRDVVSKNTNSKMEYIDSSEKQLKNILGQIKGVGEVEVMVTYETSTEIVPASNLTKSNQLTQEQDAQGGTRTTTQEDSSQNVVMTTDNSQLVVIKEIKPQVRGVVVVAEGAGDIKVKKELIEAVRTIFQVPAHKVMVYEKKIISGEE
ncbi:stage III sporulation protein AG [Clostridiaceae bacterium 35-E11]